MAEDRRFWAPDIETMPVEKLRGLQEKRLQEVVSRVYEKTDLYRRKFGDAGIKPEDIRTLDDLKKLPLTQYLEDFCRTPLQEKMTIPFEEIKVIGSTSGTLSGFSYPVLWSRKDWENHLDRSARTFWTIGVRPKDRVQVLSGYETNRLTYEFMGATVLRDEAGRQKLDNQIKLAKLVGVTVIEHLPSLVLKYFERAREIGIDIRQTDLRLVVGVGEGWAETFKKQVEEKYGVPFRTCWGAYELGYIGVQCEVGGGMHIHSDHLIVEVIDPETKQPLGPGEEGEPVVTTLIADAVPLIRYRTGDIGTLLPYGMCPCGRTYPKISMIKGRVKQRIKVGGRNILPIDIEELVASTPGLGNEYQIILDKPDELERLRLKVEFKPDIRDLRALKQKVEEAIYRDLAIESDVQLVPVGTLERTLFKAQRVITTYDKKE